MRTVRTVMVLMFWLSLISCFWDMVRVARLVLVHESGIGASIALALVVLDAAVAAMLLDINERLRRAS